MPYSVRPDVNGVSPLGRQPAKLRGDARDRTTPAWGVAVHCTGSGVVSKALARHQDPLEYAVERYLDLGTPFYAHYVIGFRGEIVQVADEHKDAQHIGFAPDQRQAFLSGAWGHSLPKAYVDAWHVRWPGHASPAHLFPGPSPNMVYVGMELLCWQRGCPGVPLSPEQLYTEDQYAAAAALAADVARRWGFITGWWDGTGMLACHEDLNPLDRTAGGQGWDPGVVRSTPYFDWSHFLAAVRAAAGVIA